MNIAHARQCLSTTAALAQSRRLTWYVGHAQVFSHAYGSARRRRTVWPNLGLDLGIYEDRWRHGRVGNEVDRNVIPPAVCPCHLRDMPDYVIFARKNGYWPEA